MSGPAAPHWYGLPSWRSAQLAATSPWEADAPELDPQDGAAAVFSGLPAAAAAR